MTHDQAMRELEALGTEQNRKVYARHGVGPEMFGVSYANLGKLRKKVKVDHALALTLWETGNHDARVFATMIADPERSTGKLLDAWGKDLDSYVLTDAFSGYVARTALARKKAEDWIRMAHEWRATAGWNVLTSLVMSDDGLETDRLAALIDTIEREIHGAKNRVRYAMNNTLIAIGIRSAGLRAQAVAAARRIGNVEVDHGETGCKTPDAVAYIDKAVSRRKSR